jgi:excisionase family DNA binding protein
MMQERPRLMSAVELADRCGVSVRMVRRLVQERRIPHIKVGRWVRFDPTDVESFIAANRIAAGSSYERSSLRQTGRTRRDR